MSNEEDDGETIASVKFTEFLGIETKDAV